MKQAALPSPYFSGAFALLLWISAAPVRADEAVYVKGGLAHYSMHGSNNGPGGSLAVGYGSTLISGEVGLSTAPSSGAGFVSLDANLILSPFGRGRVRPFVFVGAGSIGEEDASGAWYGGGAGLEWGLGRRDSLSLLGRVAGHSGGYEGPHMVSLAWKHLFSRTPRTATARAAAR